MVNSNNYNRRKLLKTVGGMFGISVTQLQYIEIASAKSESLHVNRSSFTEVSLNHAGLEDAPLTVSCGAYPYEVSDSNLCLVDHNPGRYRSLTGVASVNGSIHETGAQVTQGETRHIPVNSDPDGGNSTSLRLPEGNVYQLPSINLNQDSKTATVNVEEESYEVATGEKRVLKLSEREFTVTDGSGDRERTLSVTPTIEVSHHGAMDVLGKEDHYVLPIELIERRSNAPSVAEIAQAPDHDVVVVPTEVSN